MAYMPPIATAGLALMRRPPSDSSPDNKADLQVKQTLALALERRGYTSLTPVQEAVTDPELGTGDLLVSAQTGSGKTVGFGLAIADTILGDEERLPSAATPLALVIAPTRELALQVKRELAWLYGEAGAVLASCVGGMDMRDERRALDRGAHIVVATPGRLRDHIMRGSIDLSDLRAVVLDEADEMLDLGFREDLEFILGEAPEERQTLLFSATVPPAIAQLAKSYQRDAKRISTVAEKSQHSDIEYQAMAVAPRDDENAIINVLRYYEAPNAIVFCNTRAMVNRLLSRLSNRGFSVVALSGELSQAERSHALQAMRDGRARVCVATDVAARGIDLPNLELVIHAELPSSHETLLHRSGRTGRAGRKGVSALVVPPKARKKAERLLKMARLEVNWGPAPSADAVRGRDTERMLSDASWSDAPSGAEDEMIQQLTEAFTPAQLAAGYLRLWNASRSAPEELSEVDDKPAKREPFGPSIWFSIAVGRDDGADPRRLLPMLCRAGGITKSDIGAIRIQGDQSYAEIREEKAEGFLETLGAEMVLDDGTAIQKLDTPPNIPATRPSGPRKPGGKPAHRGKRPYDGPRDNDRPRHDRKPEHRSDAPKPFKKPVHGGKGSEAGPEFSAKPAKPAGKSAAPTADKPRSKPQGKPQGKPGAKFKDGAKDKRGPKGPPPPKGKPNSKKNKARAAASKASAKSGNAKPRRPKS